MTTLRTHTNGFTIIEMMVAVALFAIMMLISVGALLMLMAANKKAQAMQSVMNNFNISMDSIVRSVRQGYQFHCGSGTYTKTQDCLNDGDNTTFAFEPYGNQATDPARVVSYDAASKSIWESQDGGNTFTSITAPEVSITSLKFYVIGSTRGDTIQPKLIIVIDGVAAANNMRTKTNFHVETTAVQRLLDL